jgi:NAD+ diphosphatase
LTDAKTEPPTESMLEWLALARGTLDRAAERRRDQDWVKAAWADPRTRVFTIEGGRVLVSYDPGPGLVFTSPDQAPEGERYLLGVDEEDVAYFVVRGALPSIEGAERAGSTGWSRASAPGRPRG